MIVRLLGWLLEQYLLALVRWTDAPRAAVNSRQPKR